VMGHRSDNLKPAHRRLHECPLMEVPSAAVIRRCPPPA
jgi:hypothetical protein